MDEDEAFAFVTRAFGEAEEMERAERAALGKVEEMLDGYRTVLRAQLAR